MKISEKNNYPKEISTFKSIYWCFLCWIFSFFKISACNELHPKFNGSEMKVLAYQFDPLFTYKKQKDGNYTFGGLVYQIMNDAKNYFDLSYKFIIIDEAEVTKIGLIGALLKHLDNKEVDIVPYFFDQEVNNLKHMDLLSTLWIDPISVLQPWPEEESRLLVTTRPFELMVWIGFLLSTTCFILITTAIIKIQERSENKEDNPKSIRETIYLQLEYVLSIIAGQGNSVSYQAWTSLKILVGLWLLTMVVMIYAYTGVLTSLLTVPKLEPIDFTLEEVVLHNKFCITQERNTPLSRGFLDATEGYEKQIGDEFQKDPTLFATDTVNAVDHVLNRKCAYPSAMTLIKYVIYEDSKASGRCRMTTSPELDAYKSLAYQIGLLRGSPLAPGFNDYILRIHANGMVALIKKSYFPSTQKCRTDVPPETKTRVLTLLDLAPAFLIFGIGLSISFIAFLIEIIANCVFGKNKQ